MNGGGGEVSGFVKGFNLAYQMQKMIILLVEKIKIYCILKECFITSVPTPFVKDCSYLTHFHVSTNIEKQHENKMDGMLM